jgi:hypothetical protein
VQIWGSTETTIGKIKNIIDDSGRQGISSKTETLLAEKELSQEQIDFLELEAN